MEEFAIHIRLDEVKGNIFYFINSNDGYNASRKRHTQSRF